MATIHVRMPDGRLQEMSHPDSWTDAQVKEAIYKHFPSDDKASNQEKPKSKGWGGVASDVGEDIASIPDALGQFISNLPGQVSDSASQVVNNPMRAAGNVGAGLLEGSKGAVNIPQNIAEYFKSKGLGFGGGESTLDLLHKLKIPTGIGETGLQKAVLGAPQAGDELLQGIGGFTPYGRLGGLGKGLGGLAKRAGSGAAYATGQNQDPLVAALLGASGEGAIRGAFKIPGAFKNLDPAKMFRGNLSAEELGSNMRAAQGTNTPLGSVLENPNLKYLFENVTSNVPFSGAKDILGDVSKQVSEKGENLISNLRPEHVEGDVNDIVKSLLDTSYKKHQANKNDLYKERDRLAEKEGIKLDLTDFNKLASSTAKSIEDSPLFKNDPDFRKAYKKLIEFKNASSQQNKSSGEGYDFKKPVVGKKGKSLVSEQGLPSVTEASVISGNLIREGEKMKRSPNANDKSLGGLYKKLGTTLKRDVNRTIEKTGSEELNKSHQEAESNFQKSYVPFLEDDVHKFLAEGKDPQKIVREIIKPGAANDLHTLIDKINGLLPKDQKNLLGYSYLKGAENKLGEIEPKQLASLINSLGNRQFKSLFPEAKTRQEILDYGKLRGMNESALNVLHNPKTGAQNTQAIIAAAQGLLGAAVNPIAAVAPSIASRYANKALTSPKLREKLIKRMIEQSHKESMINSKERSKKSIGNLAPFMQALIESAPRKKEQEKK